MNYAEKLKDPRWQKKRLEILDRDEFTCKFCGDKETTLHVHHKKYNGDPWEADNDELLTLCEICHEFIESQKFPKEWELIKTMKEVSLKEIYLYVFFKRENNKNLIIVFRKEFSRFNYLLAMDNNLLHYLELKLNKY